MKQLPSELLSPTQRKGDRTRKRRAMRRGKR